MSDLEKAFAAQLAWKELPPAVREYKFHHSRKWRADFAWPESKLLVEIEGGTRQNGRHNRHEGYEADCEKYNTAQIAGFTVLRFTGEMVKSGQALATLQEFLCQHKKIRQ